jgi:type II secretory pathway component PulF
LRDPASVWDRLPPVLKVMRTVIWLELLLLPAGFVLAIFVIPTFQALYSSIGVEFPLMMRTFMSAVVIGGYVLPVLLLAALVQGWRWHVRHGLSLTVAFSALFSVNRDFWRETEARQLLRG